MDLGAVVYALTNRARNPRLVRLTPLVWRRTGASGRHRTIGGRQVLLLLAGIHRQGCGTSAIDATRSLRKLII